MSSTPTSTASSAAPVSGYRSFGLVGLLFRQTTWRHWKQSPRQAILLVLILAIGIGVYFSVRLADMAAIASFQNFTDLVTAQSDWVVTAPIGSLPEESLTEIRQLLGNRPVTMVPVVETTASPPPTGLETEIASGLTYTILGIDLVAIRNGSTSEQSSAIWLGQGADSSRATERFWETFRNPRSVFVSDAFSRQTKLGIGDRLPVIILEKRVELEIGGIIPSGEGRPDAPETLLVMDLPALQELAGKTGKIDRIEILAESGWGESTRRDEIRSALELAGKNRWIITKPTDRRKAGEMMTRAFRMNLTLLSLIALIVGLYLVFQALDGAVVRRREEIAILRSLGINESTIYWSWLNEALVLGIIGGVLGLVLGYAGAQGAVRLIGRTVNALYYATSADSAHLTASESMSALALSVAASLVAGWWPAREAARTPPAQILVRHGAPRSSRHRSLKTAIGTLFIVTAILLALLPPYRADAGFRIPIAGYLAAFFGVMGCGVISGELVRIQAIALRALGNRWVTARLALSQLRHGSGRHELAAASLVWAVAMTSGMAILVASFESTMQGWISRTFQADLYISSAGAQSASSQNRMTAETWRSITNLPEVLDAQVLQVADVQLKEGPTMLVGAELGFIRRHDSLAWLSPPPEPFFDTASNEGLALASESFTERFQKKLGDRVEIPTLSGIRSVLIVGTFADYGNERGSLTVDRHHLVSWVQNELATSIIVDLRPGVSAEAVRSQLLTRHRGIQVFTNSHLRRELLRIFRQTFSITYALELIGVVVAVVGLAMTLVSILLERRQDLSTCRALGMTPSILARATAWEGGLLASVGSISGACVGIGLGYLLVFVINKQVFGWTLRFEVPMGQLSGLVLLVTASAILASFSVGRWGSVLPSDHEE